METKHVTINIGPQDSASWFFVAGAIAFCALCWMITQSKDSNDVEIARIQAQTQTQSHAKP